jgi:hypothetical protein
MNQRKPTQAAPGKQGLPVLLGLYGLIFMLMSCPHEGGDDDDDSAPVSPPAITGLALAQVTGENRFTATWEAPESPPEGIRYELFYTEQGETPPAAPVSEASGFPAETPAWQSPGLKGGTAYAAWVRSVLGTQKGPWSEGVSITLKQDQTGITFSVRVFGQTRFAAVRGDDLMVQVPVNTPRPWRFTPDIALSEGASLEQGSSPGLEEAADFGDPEKPVKYPVIAENGRKQVYTVRMETGDESGLGFSLEPGEDLLGLKEPVILSIGKTQTKSLIVDPQKYRDCAWYVDGILKTRGTGLRLRAADYKAGVHYLTVNGYGTYKEAETDEEGDLVPWSTELVFTVTE